MSETLLNVADVGHHSHVNGPGVRSVVWVQGCRRHCPGCINPHTHPHQPAKLLDPEQLGRQLAAIPDTIGLTLSGGEPLEQAEACARLAETVRKAGKTVMVFTGFPLDEIRACDEPAVQRFLRAIDLIVVGPYVQELKCESKLWRASSNQTVHFLHGGDLTEEDLADTPVVEVKCDGGTLSYTGFPDLEDLTWFDQMSRGLSQPSQ
jgi:anaerobic ribonucleoside-triphosphate reductase activating protein